MADPFIAEVRMWGLNFAPRSWALCNGQLLPIAQNTALFSLIGTTYGGDGRTTTGLPNLQGRAAMHFGNGPGLSPRRLGERGGSTTTALSVARMPSHGHGPLKGVEEDATSADPAGKYLAEADEDTYGGSGTSTPMNANTVGAAGGGQAHENRQPYLAINFCICLQGTYPSRS